MTPGLPMLRLACADSAGLARELPVDLAWLGAAERGRCGELGARRRQEFVAGRWLLRRLLAQAGLADAGHALEISVGGPPRAAQLPGTHLSLSHRGGWFLAAAASHAVGVDVEVLRPRDVAAMAALACSPDEQRQLESLDEATALHQLHELWTVKEAMFKAGLTGIGPMEFHRFSLVRVPDGCCDAVSWSWSDGRFAACAAADAGGWDCVAPWPEPGTSTRWKRGNC